MTQYNITEMPKLFDMKHRYTCNYHQVRPVEAKMPLNFNLLSFLLWKVLFVLKKNWEKMSIRCEFYRLRSMSSISKRLYVEFDIFINRLLSSRYTMLLTTKTVIFIKKVHEKL